MKKVYKRICLKCKNEQKFSNWWSMIFNEDYNSFKLRLNTESAERAIREIPKIQKNIGELQEQILNIESQIKPELILEWKFLQQKLLFQTNRLEYSHKELTK